MNFFGRKEPKPDQWFTFRVDRYTTKVGGDEWGTWSTPAIEVEVIEQSSINCVYGKFLLLELNKVGFRPAIGDIIRATWPDGWDWRGSRTKYVKE